MNTANSFKKFTYPFFETLCVIDGVIQHVDYHEKRYRLTYKHHYGTLPETSLIDDLVVPSSWSSGRVKLKICYNQKEKNAVFSSYPYLPINSLQCIEAPDLNYNFKFFDRRALIDLFNAKGSCDDVLILQAGWVRDSSYANICFWDGKEWFTPKTPLLCGTMRAQLLHEKKLVLADIHLQDLNQFKGFKLINAMRDFERDPLCKMNKILPPI